MHSSLLFPFPSPSREFSLHCRPFPYSTCLHLLPFSSSFLDPFPALRAYSYSTGSSTLLSFARDPPVPRPQLLNLSVCILSLFFWARILPYPPFPLSPVPSKPVCNASISLIPLPPPILFGRAALLLSFPVALICHIFPIPFRLADTSTLPRGVQSNHITLLAQILFLLLISEEKKSQEVVVLFFQPTYK